MLKYCQGVHRNSMEPVGSMQRFDGSHHHDEASQPAAEYDDSVSS